MKPVTAVIIGAGDRGRNVYGKYALEHPEEMRVTAVAEPDPQRRREPDGGCGDAVLHPADLLLLCAAARERERPERQEADARGGGEGKREGRRECSGNEKGREGRCGGEGPGEEARGEEERKKAMRGAAKEDMTETGEKRIPGKS